ncbi:unnamed protein product [Protopolystoma xenopodis]|uniref:Amino acid transporter transmembrane domain-containing protein n=1 Tax=Protopolystoma xenopodis TaxID=117903 RepID=A0A448WEY8_9PLAT|nr:unnamed protein product [Protopolystoma xenopodis]
MKNYDNCSSELDGDEHMEGEIIEMETETTNILLVTQDPHALGENVGSGESLMHFIKGNIGTGILSMPIVFKYSGLWIGLALITFCGVVSTYLLFVLSSISNSLVDKHGLDRNTLDYADAVFYVFKFGPISKLLLIYTYMYFISLSTTHAVHMHFFTIKKFNWMIDSCILDTQSMDFLF